MQAAAKLHILYFDEKKRDQVFKNISHTQIFFVFMFDMNNPVPNSNSKSVLDKLERSFFRFPALGKSDFKS